MDRLSERKARGAFYTESWLSSMLVNNITMNPVCRFIDFGAGAGSLIGALTTRWHDLNGFSVEIDAHSIQNLKRDYPQFSHMGMDVTDCDFVEKFRDSVGNPQLDLLVSNPPYISIPLPSKLRNRLVETKNLEPLKNSTEVRAEFVFLHQAKQLASQNSEAAFILPDFIFSSSKAEFVRRYMVEDMGLYKAIEVGGRAFKATDVKTHLAFFNFAKMSSRISLGGLNSHQQLTLTRDEFIARGDFGFHNADRAFISGLTLGDVASITRGNLPMHTAKKLGLAPFHTTEFSTHSRNGIDVKRYSADLEYRLLHQNDVVMGRVGRGILRQVNSISAGEANFSDCIFKITPDAEGVTKDTIIEQLLSHRGQNWLAAQMKGSGAKSLSLKDLAYFPFIMER